MRWTAIPSCTRCWGARAGIYIIPEYGQAGFLIGGRGGAGVAAARTANGWSTPAFFSFGGLNVGLQAGGAGGSVVYLLMNRRAVSQFIDRTKVSLNANAGYAVVKYSDADQANLAKGDVIVWTNTKGAYAGATIEASGIHADDGRTREFYGRDLSAPRDPERPGLRPGCALSATGTRALMRSGPRVRRGPRPPRSAPAGG